MIEFVALELLKRVIGAAISVLVLVGILRKFFSMNVPYWKTYIVYLIPVVVIFLAAFFLYIGNITGPPAADPIVRLFLVIVTLLIQAWMIARLVRTRQGEALSFGPVVAAIAIQSVVSLGLVLLVQQIIQQYPT